VRVRVVEFSSYPTTCTDFVRVGSGPCRVRVVEFSFHWRFITDDQMLSLTPERQCRKTESPHRPRTCHPRGVSPFWKPRCRHDALSLTYKAAAPWCCGVWCLHSLMHFNGVTPKLPLPVSIRPVPLSNTYERTFVSVYLVLSFPPHCIYSSSLCFLLLTVLLC